MKKARFLSRAGLLALALFSMFMARTAAAGTVSYMPDRERYELDLKLDILEDPAGRLTLADVARGRAAGRFFPCPEEKPNWGFTSSVFWVRFTLAPGFDMDKEWLLEFEYPLLNRVEVFIPARDGGYLRKVTGNAIPFADREIRNRNLLVSLPRSAFSGRPIYVRVSSESTMSLPMTLWSARAFIRADHNEQFVLGAYYGIVCVMIIYSLLLLVGLRDISYFHHLVFIVSFGVFEMMMNGTAYEYLWPASAWWNIHALPMFITIACLGASLFTRNFLETRRYTPAIDRMLAACAAVSGVVGAVPFIAPYSLAIKVATTMALITISLLLAAGSFSFSRGCRQARWFMAAWSMFCVGIIILVFRAFGLLNNEAVYFYGPQAGSALTVILLALALTDRINLMQEKTLELQARYRSIFDNATEGIFSLTPEGKPLMANRALAGMFGFDSPEEVLAAGMSVDRMYVRAEDRARLREALFRDGVVRNFETEMYHKDGHVMDVLINVSAIRDSRGRVHHLEGIVTDISERKRRMEMQAAKDAAVMASKAKSRFLAAMSHEIRTPMNGVMGFTDMLLKMDIEPTQRRYLELIKSSADRLLGIINDILDFSRIEAGRLDLDNVAFSLRETLDAPLALLRHKAEEKGLEFVCRFADGMADRLSGDPVRLSQVVVNLVDNAVKFTDEGGVCFEVREEERSGDYVSLHFRVSDTGIGVDPEQAQRIFEPFSQADETSSRRYGGSGLGLSIAAELVRMMEGRIWCEPNTEAGRGTVFHFSAPFPLAGGAPRRPVPERGGRPAQPPPQMNVLVVDDEPVNRTLAVEVLEQEGVAAAAAESGEKALEIMADVDFDLVLMDVEMPGMDGFETTARIREREKAQGRRTRIVAMTAHAIQGYGETCREKGMDGYISKPFSAEALMAVLRGDA